MSFTDKDPNYQYRYINDNEGRLQKAIDGDYEFVNGVQPGDKEVGIDAGVDSRVSVPAGTREDGSPMRAYLMRIPRKFYEEDQKEKEKTHKAIDDAIQHGNEGTDGRYVVNNKVSVEKR